MRKAVKLGDIGTEHDGYHPTKVIVGSPDVFIDGKPAARVGDALEPHDKPSSSKHNRAIATGSSTVFINGKPAALTGGKVDCGGVTIGTGTVNIDDEVGNAGGVVIKPPMYNRTIVFDKDVTARLEKTGGALISKGKGTQLETGDLPDSWALDVVVEGKAL